MFESQVPSFAQGFVRSPGESANPELWPNLGGWVPALGATGSKLFDVSGRGHHGALVAMDASDWVPTQKGLALDLDGSAEYVTIADDPLWDLSGDFSICGSMYLRNTDTHHMWVSHGVYGTGWYVDIGYGDQTAFVCDSDFIRWAVPPTNQWVHVAIVKQGSAADNARCYYNGVLQSIAIHDTLGNPSANAYALCLGARHTPAYYVDGLLGEVYLYSHALQSAEVRRLYVDPLAPFRPRWPIFPVVGGAPGGAISGNTSAAFTAAGTISGTGALAGSGIATFSPSGAIGGTGALAGVAAIGFSPSGTVAAKGALAGSAAADFAPSGLIAGSGTLAGSTAATFAASGAISGGQGVAGSTAAVFTAGGTIGGKGSLAGSATAAFTPAGDVGTAGTLSGSAAVGFSPAGAIAGRGSLSGSLSVVFAPGGDLLGGMIAGAAACTFTARGFLHRVQSDPYQVVAGQFRAAGAVAGQFGEAG